MTVGVGPSGAPEQVLAAAAAEELSRRKGVQSHDALLVLGSGWDTALEALDAEAELVAELPATDLPGFLAPVAPGHQGIIRSYALPTATGGHLAVLVLVGRTHLFEGHGPAPVVHGVRVAAAAGARLVILTNASGGLRPEWPPGTGALVADHLNLTGESPLSGPTFTDLTDAWSPRLRGVARAADPTLVDAVYAQLRGPSIQTLAETQMLRTMGADLVGMSTVLEAVAARAEGLELLGLSAVTTAEGTGVALDPDDVVAVARSAVLRISGVLLAVLRAVREDARTPIPPT